MARNIYKDCKHGIPEQWCSICQGHPVGNTEARTGPVRWAEDALEGIDTPIEEDDECEEDGREEIAVELELQADRKTWKHDKPTVEKPQTVTPEWCRRCALRERCRAICPPLEAYLNKVCGYVYGKRLIDRDSGLFTLILSHQVFKSPDPYANVHPNPEKAIWYATPPDAVTSQKYRSKVCAENTFELFATIPKTWQEYAVDGLTDHENQLRFLYEVEGRSWEQIAEELRDSTKVLRLRYHRARSKYLKLLRMKHFAYMGERGKNQEVAAHDPGS